MYKHHSLPSLLTSPPPPLLPPVTGFTGPTGRWPSSTQLKRSLKKST